ncbi:MAG: hypothetical protein JHD16_11260 [Solirubrobacteraceae bacterium]|nr:hypothetical protein [Solirubrobacteraceae bacterium]
MSLSRPSKSQRDEWAELLGDKRRTTRRWVIRALVIPPFVAILLIPYLLLSGAGYIGGCPSPQEMTEFWAKPAREVSSGDRDAEIRRQLRCVEFEGMTRAQVMEQLGNWTTVQEYPRTAAAAKGTYLVWSNGSNTPGVGIEFTGPRGRAIRVERYEP